MVDASELPGKMEGLGFERVDLIQGSTFKDSSTVIVVPTRGAVDTRVVERWQSLISPMNQKRAMLFARGDEVGVAYNRMVQMILDHPELSKWKYVMTLEDDNLPPPDAHIRLLESIDYFKFDAMSGLYWTKGDINMPMVYGSAEEYTRTGVLDFKPQDVRQALQHGNVMECNGIAMGCALWRMDLFRKYPPPWYVSVSDVIPGKGIAAMTQDLFFSEKIRRGGNRVGVDLRVRVGHLDINTGIVY